MGFGQAPEVPLMRLKALFNTPAHFKALRKWFKASLCEDDTNGHTISYRYTLGDICGAVLEDPALKGLLDDTSVNPPVLFTYEKLRKWQVQLRGVYRRPRRRIDLELIESVFAKAMIDNIGNAQGEFFIDFVNAGVGGYKSPNLTIIDDATLIPPKQIKLTVFYEP